MSVLRRGLVVQWSLPFDDTPVRGAIRARLLARLGPQRDTRRRDPVSQLIAAMISGKTRDAVARAAFERLRRRYTPWDRLRVAAPADIEAIIRPVQYAERKAEYLPRALAMIVARSGALDLTFLVDWDEDMAMQWLRGLPGVGPKVAATVLNFSTLRKRMLAVDTHLLRIGGRPRPPPPRGGPHRGPPGVPRPPPHPGGARHPPHPPRPLRL